MNIQELAKNYKIDQAGAAIVRQARLVFLCGIVAAGKDTVLEQLLKSPDYHRLISHTTRPRRTNDGVIEQDSVDYHFVSEDQMSQLLENHQMVEVNNFGGKYYGTSINEVSRANSNGKIAVTDIDVHGVQSFRNIAPNNVVAVFIVPPDYETWIQRLNKRYESKEESLAQIWQARSSIAVDEINHAINDGGYYFIVNDDLAETVSELDKIVRRASRGEKVDDSVARQTAVKLLADIKSHI